MPFPPANYYACFPLQAYFVDKTSGAPLSGGYIQFFEDEARTIPKNVFIQQQQPDNSYLFINIGSTVTLSSVGTTQYLGTDCIIFLYPFDVNGNEQLYYIEVFSSANILQFTREAWPPGVASGLNPSTSFISSENVVSNPQFAEVLFAPAPAAATTFSIAAALSCGRRRRTRESPIRQSRRRLCGRSIPRRWRNFGTAGQWGTIPNTSRQSSRTRTSMSRRGTAM